MITHLHDLKNFDVRWCKEWGALEKRIDAVEESAIMVAENAATRKRLVHAYLRKED